MQESLNVQIVVENPWQTILLEIRFSGHRIQTNLMWFENRPEGVIVNMSYGVVLMIVALGAIQGLSEESLANVFNCRIQPSGSIE